MRIHTLVAAIRGSADIGVIVDAASSLFAGGDGHLIAVHSELAPAAFVPAIGIEGIPYDLSAIKEGRERMSQLQGEFVSACERAGISGEWRGAESFSGDSAVSAVSSALAADLVIIQQPDRSREVGVDLEAVLFESGRPVLVLPTYFKGPLTFKKAVIAWNGSREAARAAFDALPLLEACKQVEILSVDAKDKMDQSRIMAAAEIARSLSRHGLNVSVENTISDTLPVSAVIYNRLSDTDADLLVMGAFSRSRLSELLFGGVTKSMLDAVTVPTLLSR